AIRVLLEARRLEMGHARALLTLSPELASKLAAEAVEHGWSVREVEHRAAQFAAGKLPASTKKKPGGRANPPPDIATLENELSESLGARVSIQNGRGNKGKLVIHYANLDALDGVLERLRRR
ncbi:MAG: chromosome partitioning protein ParB, partial [Luteimonas sp.]|nr:chromosome partitioning protein ParB [Luteimonas sp.]